MAAIQTAGTSPEPKHEGEIQQTTPEPQPSSADAATAQYPPSSSPSTSIPSTQPSSAPDSTQNNTIAATTTTTTTTNPDEPSISPTLTLPPDICPSLNRSVSTASSDSLDGVSTSSRLSDPGTTSKRRGYMRPQATLFAESAKNRESVMSLGTIAHLQYYFARTGLLDGKGGQLAREDGKSRLKKRAVSGLGPGVRGGRTNGVPRAVSMSVVETPLVGLAAGGAESSCAVSDSGLVESPIEEEEGSVGFEGGEEPLMLPPTVSTYNQRPAYVPPPPDLTTLRRELTEALEDALKVLKESDKCPDDSQGWYELQGLHLLDITTLAIRAAKTYYTAHTHPQALYAIKSEREIRKELYEVLEILKKMAGRNFQGGIRKAEKVGILQWIVGISEVIQCEIEGEKKEQEKREKFSWRTGDWTGREREREFQFLRCFIDAPDELAEWTDANAVEDEELPTQFLQHFQNGLKLVLLHNELVRESKRHFEEIKTWHSDTAKPYRCAENLRFWIKAAQLRWEINLDVDVMGVVQGTKPEAWRKFDDALMRWCKNVREELTTEWEQQRTPGRKAPSLKVDTIPKDEQTSEVVQIGNNLEQLKV